MDPWSGLLPATLTFRRGRPEPWGPTRFACGGAEPQSGRALLNSWGPRTAKQCGVYITRNHPAGVAAERTAREHDADRVAFGAADLEVRDALITRDDARVRTGSRQQRVRHDLARTVPMALDVCDEALARVPHDHVGIGRVRLQHDPRRDAGKAAR